jgi:iron complex outermembrane recepter protein
MDQFLTTAAGLCCLPIIVSLLTKPALAQDQPPVKTLGTITVTSDQPSSLPTQIPTTVEGVTRKQIENQINATDSEDAIKYLPSLNVRRRYIGDFDHAVLASRASGTGNSARSLFYADGILLSNLLGNGASFTPRWGMVTPEEIERVDVLYGPFSAAYPGNSAGAVVDYVTRMPRELESHAKLGGFSQRFNLYATDRTYTGAQASASIGNRTGAWSWWFNVNQLSNDGQPIAFANRLLSSGVPGAAGTPVTGAIADRNPRNQDWWLLGATSQTQTLQDHAKFKLAYDFTPSLRASYTAGLWRNDATRRSESYLRDPAGKAVYGGVVNIDNKQYSLSAADFAPTRNQSEHWIHGLSVKSNTRGVWDWEIAASLYDYASDVVRTPTVVVDSANSAGIGRLTNQAGTGWNTLALRGTWRPAGYDGAHTVNLGYQRNSYRLRNRVNDTADWINGGAGAQFSAFQGKSELHSLYAQDAWAIAPDWRVIGGLRLEQWQASDGVVANATVSQTFAPRREQYVSPKAAIAYQASPLWMLKASTGRAVRTPTVAELFQGSIAANLIQNNDPNLKAEKSWTSELSAERDLGKGFMRATLFFEDSKDALYSQTNVTVSPNVTSIQNIDAIRTRGVELAYQNADVLVRGFDLSTSLTFADSIITRNDKFPDSVGKWQPRVPRWRSNLLASYRPDDRWSYTLGLRYSGKQFGSLDNGDPNGAAFTGFSRFLVADVRLRYRLAKQWAVAVGVDNLNNASYCAFHPYPQRTVFAEVRFDL